MVKPKGLTLWLKQLLTRQLLQTQSGQGNLVQQGYDGFLETLYPVTVYGQVRGRRFEFGKARSVIIPSRKPGSDVSGGFVGEGQTNPG